MVKRIMLRMFLDHTPIGRKFAKMFVSHMVIYANWRMHRTVKIEMNVPLLRFSSYIKKMQHRISPALFVKSAGALFMVCEEPREVSSGG